MDPVPSLFVYTPSLNVTVAPALSQSNWKSLIVGSVTSLVTPLTDAVPTLPAQSVCLKSIANVEPSATAAHPAISEIGVVPLVTTVQVAPVPILASVVTGFVSVTVNTTFCVPFVYVELVG